MIGRDELGDWAERFGVGTDQIERDHLISHVLTAIEFEGDAETRFYGGTALCRSYLDGSRLSEDIDLLHPDPARLLAVLADAIPRALHREFPELGWSEGDARSGGASARIAARGLTPIRLDVGAARAGHPAWVFRSTSIALRYSDLPPVAVLAAPSLETFAAMKMSAWMDRHTPRDLFDLAGLSDAGALNATSEGLLRRAAGFGFQAVEFTSIRRATREAWASELAAQTGSLPSVDECAARVLRSIDALHT